MPLGAGDLSPIGEKVDVSLGARLCVSDMWNADVMLSTFAPIEKAIAILADKFEYAVLEDLLKKGTLHAAPGIPDQMTFLKAKAELARVLFQDLETTFPSNHTATAMLFSSETIPQNSTNVLSAAAQAEMEEWMMWAQREHVKVFVRTINNWVLKLFSTSSFTLSVDEADITYATGVNAINASGYGGQWDNAATDIFKGFRKIWEYHVQQCGVEPTHCCFDFRLPGNIADNTRWKSMVDRDVNLAAQHRLPKWLDPDLRTLKEVPVSDVYKNSSGVSQYDWGQWTLSLVSQTDDLITHKTSRNARNDFQGGTHSWRFHDPKTRDYSVLSSDNRGIVLSNPSNVTVVTLNA